RIQAAACSKESLLIVASAKRKVRTLLQGGKRNKRPMPPDDARGSQNDKCGDLQNVKNRTWYFRLILPDWHLTTEEQLITVARNSGMTNGVQAPQRSLHVPNIQGNPMKQWIKVLLTT